MCIDYYSLNWQKKLDVFLIPQVADLFDHLGKAIEFNSIDLIHVYHWVCEHKGYEQKPTFKHYMACLST